jgi:alpha-D-xyloside xylohydrolase
MVCPVHEYKSRNREVYLPETDGWYDANTGEFLEGGQSITANAPYDILPMYVKAGSIVPMGPVIEYTDQKPADPITVIVYAGADGQFELYEDEGTNYNYENGNFSLIPISWSERDQTLTFEKRQGQFNGMIQNRVFRILKADSKNAIVLDNPGDQYKEIKYNGNQVEVSFN